MNISEIKKQTNLTLQRQFVELPNGKMISTDEVSRVRLFSALQMLQQMPRLVEAGMVESVMTEIEWISHNNEIVMLNEQEIETVLAMAMLYHYNLKLDEYRAIQEGSNEES